jgi:endonuclease YncB( thermonuclease family)
MTLPTHPHPTLTSRVCRSMVFLLCLAFLPVLQAATLSGQVLGAPNGQQLLLKTASGQQLTIRLAGIRSPAIGSPRPDIGQRFLHTLLAGKPVTVDFTARSRGGVIIGTVLYGGADIGLRLLRSGLAEVTDDPAPPTPELLLQYRQAEQSARQHGMGYWQSRQ